MNDRNKVVDYAVWLACWILLAVAVVLFVLDAWTPFSIDSLRYSCWIYRTGHFYCPGCGGTRAFFALLQGDWVQSLQNHPVVCYCAVWYAVCMGKGMAAFLFPEKVSYMRFRLGYVYVGIAIIIIQFLAKNILLLGFGYHWI